MLNAYPTQSPDLVQQERLGKEPVQCTGRVPYPSTLAVQGESCHFRSIDTHVINFTAVPPLHCWLSNTTGGLITIEAVTAGVCLSKY